MGVRRKNKPWDMRLAECKMTVVRKYLALLYALKGGGKVGRRAGIATGTEVDQEVGNTVVRGEIV